MKHFLFISILLCSLSDGAIFTVTNNANSGAGSLRQAISDCNSSPDANNTITISSGLGAITLTSSLPPIENNVSINGPVTNQSIDANSNRAFVINPSVTATIQNISIENATSIGSTGRSGGGGGGGAVGAGGGLYISETANVTIANVLFDSCQAIGGDGGNGGGSFGGGGGGGQLQGSQSTGLAGGAGGLSGGGGGGGAGGSAALGAGGLGGASGGNGATAGGNGQPALLIIGGTSGSGGIGGKFGGAGGGGNGGSALVIGGEGGDGGGGGASIAGGAGGGGGGGWGLLLRGLPGAGGQSTAGGGRGGDGLFSGGDGGGGGGSGLGGAIFIEEGGSLSIAPPSSGTLFNASSVVGGSGGSGSSGAGNGTSGAASGVDLFLVSGSSCTFDVASGTFVMANSIESILDNPGGGIIKIGAGSLDFASNDLSNTYTGSTEINAGTLIISSDANLGNANNSVTLSGGSLQVESAMSSIRPFNLTAATSSIISTNDECTLSTVISGAGAVTKTGAATLIYSGSSANTNSGLTTVSEGTLLLDKSGAIALSGDAVINGGSLQLAAPDQIANASSITIDSGTFDLNGNAETINSLIFNGGTLSQGAATLTLASNTAPLTMRDTTISGSIILNSGTVAFDATNNGTATINGNINHGAGTISYDIENGSAPTDMLINSVIESGALTKTGAGTLELSADNTFTGITSVDAGTLNLNATGNAIAGDVLIGGGTLLLTQAEQIANSSDIILNSGTFDLNANSETINSLTFNGGTLSQGGATLTLASGSNPLTMRDTTISGPISLSGGTITFDSTNNNSATISGNITQSALINYNVENGNAATDMFISGIISGAGALTKTGTGVLELSGNNTFTGHTTISSGAINLNATSNAINSEITIEGGTLKLLQTDQISDTSNLTLNSGTFDLNGNSETINSLTFNGGTLTQGGAALTLASGTTPLTMRDTAISGPISLNGGTITFDSTNNGTATISGDMTQNAAVTYDIENGTAATDMLISGVVNGVGGLIKTNTGNLQLAGDNTFTGLTSVNAGTLNLNATGNAISGDIAIGGGLLFLSQTDQISNSSDITLNSGTFGLNANNETINSLTFNGGLLTQNGATLTLASGTNPLTMRDTTISGPISLNGGTLSFDSTNNGTATISGNITQNATVVYDIENGIASTDMLISGSISGAGSLTKTNTGSLQLTADNTFTGLTSVNAGTLNLNATGNAISGDITIGGGTLLLSQPDQLNNSSDITLNSGTFDLNTNNETINSLTFNGGQLTQNGATLTLASGTNPLTMRDTTISGPLNLSGGTVNFDSTNNGTATISGNIIQNAAVTYDIENGTALTDMLINGIISGAGGLTKTNTGALELTAENTFTGLTSVNAGTLNLNATGNAISGDITIGGGTLLLSQANQISNSSDITLNSGTFDLNANSETINNLTYNGGLLTQNGATLTLFSTTTPLTMRDTTITGPLVLNGGLITFDATNNSTATINGTIDQNTNTITYHVENGTAATDMLISGIISNGAVIKTGAGVLQLAATNDYSGGTLINAGTILGTTQSIQGNITNNANLLFDQNFLGTFSGELDGTGTLIKNGSGTLILTGTNTYTGGTTLSEGTLQGDTNSLQGDILNNSSLIFDQSITGTYTGSISGTGTLTKTNAGTLIFTESNTYTGETIISEGRLEGNTNNLWGDITNEGVVVFDQGFDATFSGRISGSGEFIKEGTATLILSGENTYTGGTTVNNGILMGDTSCIHGEVTLIDTLDLYQNFDGVYEGTMHGSGRLMKEGTGNVTLVGNHSIEGRAMVLNGKLSINGMLQGGNEPLIVGSGATLQGTGTIEKNVHIYGNIAPGASVGTTTVVGDFTFFSGSTLENEINSVTSDLLDVTGSVTIEPNTTLQILPEPGTIFLDQYLIITTTGGVTGTFDNITSTSPFTTANLTYTANEVFLQFLSISFGLPNFGGGGARFPNFGGNAGKVSNILNSIDYLPGEDITKVATQLLQIPTESELKQALLQLQPSAFTALGIAQENNMLNVQKTLNQHLEKIDLCSAPCEGTQIWADQINGATWQSHLGEEPGYRAYTPGAVIGADRYFGTKMQIGGAVGYTYTHLNWKKQRGKSDINSAYAAGFANWTGANTFVTGTLMGSYQNYKTKRNIKFEKIDRVATSSHNGLAGSAQVKGGLYIQKTHLLVTPYTHFDYLYIHEKSYKEKNAESLNLKIKTKNSDLFTAGVGVNTAYCFRTRESTLTPNLLLGIDWEKRFIGRKISSEFVGSSLNVKGMNPSRTIIAYGTGLSYYHFRKQIRLTVNAKGEYANHYNHFLGTVEFSKCF